MKRIKIFALAGLVCVAALVSSGGVASAAIVENSRQESRPVESSRAIWHAVVRCQLVNIKTKNTKYSRPAIGYGTRRSLTPSTTL